MPDRMDYANEFAKKIDKEMKGDLVETIEEYDGCHYYLFMHFGKLSHVNLIASAYDWTGIDFEALFNSFGSRDVIYTLVEK